MTTTEEEPPSTTNSSLKTVRQSVFEVLTCPLCYEYMCPPITLCQAGHNICARCRPGLQFSGGNKCPRCGRVLLDTRNVALESIARGLKYPCRYSPAGCKLKFSMDEIGKHHAGYELQLEKNGGKQSALLSSQVHGENEDIDQVFVAGESMRIDFDMLMNFVKGTRTMRILARTRHSLME
ncbi:hypothetical protein C0J52_04785 [Blattella germanica]|nr:hypothetical protein C0J52_04785 [Blattella germanica]